MKGLKIFFAVCLIALGFRGVQADNGADTARAATRRGTTAAASAPAQSNATTTRSKHTATSENQSGTASTGTVASRGTVTQTGTATRDRTTVSRDSSQTVKSRENAAASRTGASVQSRGTVMRTGTATGASKAATTTRTPVSSGGTSRVAVSRTAVKPTVAAQLSSAVRSAIPTRAGMSRSATLGAISTAASSARKARTGDAKVSRAAVTREEIMNRNYSACKTVYYECMDEFCANKDSQLKRCACSTRIHEFDSVKKNLAAVEDKMLDFSQRLLTVNMDKEDAAALNVATEGELAFQQSDKSASKKMLDEIAKKLKTSFDSDTFGTGVGGGSLSWSLNMDAAFDDLDSMMGATTTTKTGTDLYAAAVPICREMAQEICSEDEMSIVISGYQVAIEQDCNTVAKSYQTQVDQARDKVREGGALLDISRLDVYQDKNSDDILTCKKKMLEMLTDTSVCGANLGKCLDTTGRYIDPSTGAAFLTVNLANLGTLITRPAADESWTKAPGNSVFVTYLQSKKKYIEPAVEHCQDIADMVWDEFIEDALAQIKIAQERKLEDMRQSCTTLTAQCLTSANQSLAEFDARALSIFGVQADITAAAMCADIKTACTALLESSGGDDWVGGMDTIATNVTYESIMQTCREVGRSCIIQACSSVSGNFGLCMNTNTSPNRKSIMSRSSCWSDVLNCVANAGSESITNIMELLKDNQTIDDNGRFYDKLYATGKNWTVSNFASSARTLANAVRSRISPLAATPVAEEQTTKTPIYDLCISECGCNTSNDGGTSTCTKVDTSTCRNCRLAERIWGNCEYAPETILSDAEDHNKIQTPVDSQETLLYWLAQNTNSTGDADNCRSIACGAGFVQTGAGCVAFENIPTDCETNCSSMFQIDDANTNCCDDGEVMQNGVCCKGKVLKKTVYYLSQDPKDEADHLVEVPNMDFCIPYKDGDDKGKETMQVLNGGRALFLSHTNYDKLTGDSFDPQYPYNVAYGQFFLICANGDVGKNNTESKITCKGGRFILVPATTTTKIDTVEIGEAKFGKLDTNTLKPSFKNAMPYYAPLYNTDYENSDEVLRKTGTSDTTSTHSSYTITQEVGYFNKDQCTGSTLKSYGKFTFDTNNEHNFVPKLDNTTLNKYHLDDLWQTENPDKKWENFSTYKKQNDDEYKDTSATNGASKITKWKLSFSDGTTTQGE